MNTMFLSSQSVDSQNSAMSTTPIKLGLIGCGNFGQFCLRIHAELAEVQIVAVADINMDLAEETARKYGARAFGDPGALINTPEIEMVHIATPPFMHYPLALQAAQNGKHVICEKPLALSLQEADEMLSAARQRNVIMPVNFVIRYVPIADMVKRIIQSGTLGEPLHAYFENYAMDSQLDKAHWFWDKSKSGGIFVEHGVHFFDLYRYWFGDMEVLHAHAEVRPDTEQEDRVMCLLRNKAGMVASHYHGFDQPVCLDRAEHRILFERGDLTVKGWIPESIVIHAIVDDKQLDDLKSMTGDSSVSVLENLNQSGHHLRGRGKIITATQRIKLEYKSPLTKPPLYANAIRSLILDQIAFIRNRRHHRKITEENGREALATALTAAHAAEEELN